MSELKYLAIPSIIGRTDHAVRFKIIAFIGEILSNQIISKGIDLGRTLWDQNNTRIGTNDLKYLFKSFVNRFA